MSTRRRLGIEKIRARLLARTVPLSEADLHGTAVVFVPHPDDETLGCGGTILRMRQLGTTVHLVFMTDGSGSHAHLMPSRDLAARRMKEAFAAAEALGVPQNAVHWLAFPDGQLFARIDEATARVQDILAEVQPRSVFVPHHHELPVDHRATTAIARLTLSSSVRCFEYPVWFWHQFPFTHPTRSRADIRQWGRNTSRGLGGFRLAEAFNCRVDIASVLTQKQYALAQHRTQMESQLPGWLTLATVSNGEWLDCFFQPWEWFWEAR